MKHLIRFTASTDTIELDADTLAIQQPGVFVLVSKEQVVGTFPIHAIAGIWTPDGPAQVQLATPGVTL
jgi:hypothetical protein